MNLASSFAPDILAAMQRAAMPDFARWQRMVYATGGCAQPVRLHGERLTFDGATGEILDVYRTADEPTGFLLTAWPNRPYPRTWVKRHPPDLAVIGPQGWRDVTVTMGPRSGCYLVSIRNGPDLQAVGQEQPEKVLELILAARGT